MQARPGGSSAAPPLVTRRAVLRLSAVTAVGVLLLAAVGKPAQDVAGFAIALILAATLVGVILTYAGGCILAWRSRSPLWFCVVFLLPPPMGAAAVALFGTPHDRSPGAAGR